MFILLSWLPLILVLLVFQFVVAPVIIRFRHTHPASPEFEPINVGQLPPHVADSFTRFIHAMEADGFMFVGYFRQLAYMRNVGFFMTLLKNTVTGDIATIIFLFRKGGLVPLTTSQIEFCTGFADGTEVNTNNGQYPSTFKTYPEKRIFKFPELHNPRLMYQLHRRLCANSAPGIKSLKAADGKEAFQLSYGAVKEIRKQAEFGYFYLDEKSNLFRPTWKGAFLMTWKLAWPVGQLRKVAIKSRARATMRSLGLGGLT